MFQERSDNFVTRPARRRRSQRRSGLDAWNGMMGHCAPTPYHERRICQQDAGSTLSTRESALVRENPIREAGEAAAGDADAKDATNKALIEGRIVLEGVDDGANFLTRFRSGDAADAIEVAMEKFRPQAVNEKRDGLDLRLHGIPENRFCKAVLGVFEAGTIGGSEVVMRVHVTSF